MYREHVEMRPNEKQTNKKRFLNIERWFLWNKWPILSWFYSGLPHLKKGWMSSTLKTTNTKALKNKLHAKWVVIFIAAD